jgi:hypothetical protein
MTRLLASALFAMAAAGLPAGAAHAHHGWSGYDQSKTVRLSGRVQASAWGNPHGTLELTDGAKRWRVILAPTARMQTRGLAEGDIAVGKTVRVEGYANTGDAGELRAERIIVGDKTVELR